MLKKYGTTKGIVHWECVKFVFEQAYNHYVWRTGKPCKEQKFLRYLIEHAAGLELRRKKEGAK